MFLIIIHLYQVALYNPSVSQLVHILESIRDVGLTSIPACCHITRDHTLVAMRPMEHQWRSKRKDVMTISIFAKCTSMVEVWLSCLYAILIGIKC